MQARLNRLQVDFVKFLNHAAEQYSRDSDILGIALQAIVILIAKVRVSRAIMIRIFSMSIFCRIFVRAVANTNPPVTRYEGCIPIGPTPYKSLLLLVDFRSFNSLPSEAQKSLRLTTSRVGIKLTR